MGKSESSRLSGGGHRVVSSPMRDNDSTWRWATREAMDLLVGGHVGLRDRVVTLGVGLSYAHIEFLSNVGGVEYGGPTLGGRLLGSGFGTRAMVLVPTDRSLDSRVWWGHFSHVL
ncbi:hypothetical protein CRG98_048166 [Punica granatum]|uniref:Uncharacterized protein n=1 Tax=Punica granatum TaxID=22663 RepID=A0A2I0HIL4_PUNGR|nr:hypothetical protein CRG98_048166 [Punica granatum]